MVACGTIRFAAASVAGFSASAPSARLRRLASWLVSRQVSISTCKWHSGEVNFESELLSGSITHAGGKTTSSCICQKDLPGSGRVQS